MSDTRVTLDLRPGNTVRVTRDSYRGEVPAGSTGTFLRYESVPDPFAGRDARRTMAVVRLLCRSGETFIMLSRLAYTVGQAPTVDRVREAQKHTDLATAHDRVARALEDLRRVEESYR